MDYRAGTPMPPLPYFKCRTPKNAMIKAKNISAILVGKAIFMLVGLVQGEKIIINVQYCNYNSGQS